MLCSPLRLPCPQFSGNSSEETQRFHAPCVRNYVHWPSEFCPLVEERCRQVHQAVPMSEGLKGFPCPLIPPEILKPRPGFFSILTQSCSGKPSILFWPLVWMKQRALCGRGLVVVMGMGRGDWYCWMDTLLMAPSYCWSRPVRWGGGAEDIIIACC